MSPGLTSKCTNEHTWTFPSEFCLFTLNLPVTRPPFLFLCHLVPAPIFKPDRKCLLWSHLLSTLLATPFFLLSSRLSFSCTKNLVCYFPTCSTLCSKHSQYCWDSPLACLPDVLLVLCTDFLLSASWNNGFLPLSSTFLERPQTV